MAEATNTRPTRARGAAKAAPAAKATPAKAAPKAAQAEAEAAVKPVVVELAHVSDTKNWSKWAFPADGAFGTGNLYAPLGTEAVKVALYGVPETA